MDDELRRVFAEVFPAMTAPWSDTLSPAEVSGWDSYGHLALAEALEQRFGIQFEEHELSEMENVARIKTVLKRHGVVP